MKRINKTLLSLFFALPVLAGPPLICHRIDVGDAQSLPWRNVDGWDGAVRSYDVHANLVKDTLALLKPATPVKARMETMRRAAIYAARDARLATELWEKLEARAKSAGTALDWFDAGYWIESVRQASFIYRYDMLSAAEKQSWQIRSGLAGLDGYPLVKKALDLGGGADMRHAMSLIEEYRKADQRRSGT